MEMKFNSFPEGCEKNRFFIMGIKLDYHISMNNFYENLHTSWRTLHIDCDVTLVCEDKPIKAHKAILSESSSLLKTIIKQSKKSIH